MGIGFWVNSEECRKTGCIPTLYCHTDTCGPCPLLKAKRCYSRFGTPLMAFRGIEKIAAHDPGRYSLPRVLDKRRQKARFARLSAFGEPLRAKPRRELREAVDLILSEGLRILGFTHAWRTERANWPKNYFRASCEEREQVVQAREEGWRGALVLPFDFEGDTFTLPNGERGRVCRAYREDINCNTCGMCAGKIACVGFPDHGPQARARIRAQEN